MERIKNTAIANDIWSQEHSDYQKLAQLIFHPGFSTSESVTEISGRGIGLDSVRSSLRKSGMDITIQLEIDQEDGSIRFIPFSIVISLPPKNHDSHAAGFVVLYREFSSVDTASQRLRHPISSDLHGNS